MKSMALFRNKSFDKLLSAEYRKFSSVHSLVITNEVENAGVITLNRPQMLNSLNLEMIQGIHAALHDFEPRKDLVIIKGAGEKSFCAGGDVNLVHEYTPADIRTFFRNQYRLNELIGYFKKPYISLIDGICMGGGAGLSINGKYRVATERTVFAMPETSIGHFPDVGASHFLTRLPGNLGIYLGLTGFRLKGQDVQKSGIATHYIESSKLDALEGNLTRCKNSSDVEKTLNKFSSFFNEPAEFSLEPLQEKIQTIFSGKNIEEIFKRLQADGSEWSKKTLKQMKKMSPGSLKITLRQLQLGNSLSLRDCLKMEFRITSQNAFEDDFKEGVRALIIDKDFNPKWKHENVEKVPDDYVNQFFAPLSDELSFEKVNV